MKTEYEHVYQTAFKLKNHNRFHECIAELKRLIAVDADPSDIAPLMIAMIYAYELTDHEQALPYAKRAIQLKPKNQLASLCLVHSLFQLDKVNNQYEIQMEIRRFVATGGKLDIYNELFEENGLSIEDFK